MSACFISCPPPFHMSNSVATRRRGSREPLLRLPGASDRICPILHSALSLHARHNLHLCSTTSRQERATRKIQAERREKFFFRTKLTQEFSGASSLLFISFSNQSGRQHQQAQDMHGVGVAIVCVQLDLEGGHLQTQTAVIKVFAGIKQDSQLGICLLHAGYPEQSGGSFGGTFLNQALAIKHS